MAPWAENRRDLAESGVFARSGETPGGLEIPWLWMVRGASGGDSCTEIQNAGCEG